MPLHTGPIEENREDCLREALTETLELAQKNYIPLYLTGGTATAIYAGRSVRPLSFDLDFMVYVNPLDQSVIQKITRIFGVTFRAFTEKPLFKSTKAVGKSTNDCDLDFILDQKIVPDENRPDLFIKAQITDTTAQYAQRKKFNRVDVWTVPPEYVVLTKLFAGRGRERGKYDLLDAAAVLKNRTRNNFHTAVFIKLLQDFCPSDAKPAIKAEIKQRVLEKMETLKTTPEYGITVEEDRTFLSELQTAIMNAPL